MCLTTESVKVKKNNFMTTVLAQQYKSLINKPMTETVDGLSSFRLKDLFSISLFCSEIMDFEKNKKVITIML